MAESATSKTESSGPWADLGRVQRAALTAGAALAADWARLAAQYAEHASGALAGLVLPRRDAPDPGAVLLAAFQQYVAGVGDLPRIAGLRFYAELERLGGAKPTQGGPEAPV